MNPTTKQEWQEAIDAADAMLTLNAAIVFDLVDIPAQVDIRRCMHTISEGRERGMQPRREKLEEHLIGALDRERHRAQASQPHRPNPI